MTDDMMTVEWWYECIAEMAAPLAREAGNRLAYLVVAEIDAYDLTPRQKLQAMVNANEALQKWSNENGSVDSSDN
jgi:hypothetical protein